jgi:hypothetical protein
MRKACAGRLLLTPRVCVDNVGTGNAGQFKDTAMACSLFLQYEYLAACNTKCISLLLPRILAASKASAQYLLWIWIGLPIGVIHQVRRPKLSANSLDQWYHHNGTDVGSTIMVTGGCGVGLLFEAIGNYGFNINADG